MQWPGPDAMSLGRCKQTEWEHRVMVTELSTTPLHTATQHDMHLMNLWRTQFCMVTLCNCTLCLGGAMLTAVEAVPTNSPVYLVS